MHPLKLLFVLPLALAFAAPPAPASKGPVFEFQARAIDPALRAKMQEAGSWMTDCPVGLDVLRLVELTHWDRKGRPQTGQLIVHKDVTEDIAGIFADLFEAKYPIDKMRLIHEYEASDLKSVTDNNSSAFCCRLKTGKRTRTKEADWSLHSFGRAIDLNPVFNPYVKRRGKTVIPPAGRPYHSKRQRRAKQATQPELIVKNGAVVHAFKKRGWEWGGDWTHSKDYQHFDKKKQTP